MKFKRAGIATKLVVVILIVYAVVTLINLQTRIDDAEREKAALAAAVAYGQVVRLFIGRNVLRHSHALRE